MKKLLILFIVVSIISSCKTVTYDLMDSTGKEHYEPVMVKYRFGKAYKSKSASSTKWQKIKTDVE